MDEMKEKVFEIKVERIFLIQKNGGIKAFADIVLNDSIVIKGLKVLEDRTQALFVSMPSEKAKDGKWYETVRCLNQSLRQQITDTVLQAYSEQRGLKVASV